MIASCFSDMELQSRKVEITASINENSDEKEMSMWKQFVASKPKAAIIFINTFHLQGIVISKVLYFPSPSFTLEFLNILLLQSSLYLQW